MIAYALIGCGLYVLLFAGSVDRSVLVRAIAGSIALAFFGASWIAIYDAATYLGPDPWYVQSPFKEVIVFFTMALGMVARTLTIAIEQRRRRLARDRTASASLRLDPWDFATPFLVSFITFGAVISHIGGPHLSTADLVFSFQNGFFWQTLLNHSKT